MPSPSDENLKEKSQINEIINIHEIIRKIQEEIEVIKINQMKTFKKKYDICTKTYRNGIENELIFSALFGNGITI